MKPQVRAVMPQQQNRTRQTPPQTRRQDQEGTGRRWQLNQPASAATVKRT